MEETFVSAMIKALIPFWIYWGLLVLGCILFFCIPILPLILFIFLPMLLVIIPVWMVIVYLIGNAVSREGRINRISQRFVLSFLCSFLTIMLFPVGSWIYDGVQWDKFYLDSLIENFHDKPLWIMFAIHFFIFWIGEEMGNLAAKADREENNKPEDAQL